MSLSRITGMIAARPASPASLPRKVMHGLITLLLLLPAVWMALVVALTLVWDRAWSLFRQTRIARWLGGRLASAAGSAAKWLLKDERDTPYLYTLFGVGILMPAAFLGSLWWQARLSPGFSWFAVYIYHVVMMGPYMRFFAHTSTLIHKEGHQPRGLFKPRFRFLNRFFGSFLGIFYGHVPESYPIGHLRIHHKYDNGFDDVTSTLALDRTQPAAWLVYLRQFALYWTGISIVYHFYRRGKLEQARKMIGGMVLFYGTITAFMIYDVRFGFAYLLLPHLSTILYLAAINYTWHAFADPDNPDNDYVASLTIVDGQYNVFNEDFHVAHHLHPQMHWTEVDRHYYNNIDLYRQNMATVFRDTQTFEIFIWIMMRRFDRMAEHFVDLTGKLSHEQKKALLVWRMQPLKPAEARRIA